MKKVFTVVVYGVDVPSDVTDPQTASAEILGAVLPDISGARIQFPKQVLAVMNDGVADPDLYAVWFDKESSSWSKPEYAEYNWMFLRSQQNWANDMLRARGHMFLNDLYGILGLPHTSIGALVGWFYGPDTEGENFIDFGCWDQADSPADPKREGDIRLTFNVDGPIWHLID